MGVPDLLAANIARKIRKKIFLALFFMLQIIFFSVGLQSVNLNDMETELKKKAVQEYLADISKTETVFSRWLYGRFMNIWQSFGIDRNQFFWCVTIAGQTHRIDENYEGWDFLYHALGLSERDAVAELREESDKYFTELKAERARNAALVAALEDMYLAYGTTVKIGQLNGLRTVQTNIGRDIKHALAANEKGGVQG